MDDIIINMLRYIIIITFILSVNSNAATLTEAVSGLKILKLGYGVNNLQISRLPIIISKGYFASEAAGGGDGYSIFLKQEGKWQLARLDDGKASNEVIIWSKPHTGEDAIKSVMFLTDKNNAGLYILVSERDYNESPQDAVPVKLSLYKLREDTDFNIWYISKISDFISNKNYCNSDEAIKAELKLPITVEKHKCGLFN